MYSKIIILGAMTRLSYIKYCTTVRCVKMRSHCISVMLLASFPSVTAQTGFVPDLIKNPEDQFSRDMAQL